MRRRCSSSVRKRHYIIRMNDGELAANVARQWTMADSSSLGDGILYSQLSKSQKCRESTLHKTNKHFSLDTSTIIFNFNWVCRSLVCENEIRDKLSLSKVQECARQQQQHRWCTCIARQSNRCLLKFLLVFFFFSRSFLFSAPICKFSLSKCSGRSFKLNGNCRGNFVRSSLCL